MSVFHTFLYRSSLKRGKILNGFILVILVSPFYKFGLLDLRRCGFSNVIQMTKMLLNEPKSLNINSHTSSMTLYGGKSLL